MNTKPSGQCRQCRAGGVPWLTAVLVVAADIGTAWPAPSLLLAREPVMRGELWTLWTAHLVHFGWSHFGWDAAVLAIVGGWSERIAPRRTRALYLLAPPVIGLAVLANEPALQSYGGLSGLAAGCVALLALTGLGRPDPGDRWFWLAVLGLLGAKILVDLRTGLPLLAQFGDGDARPVPVAHIAGVFAAIIVHAGGAALSNPPSDPEEARRVLSGDDPFVAGAPKR